MQRTETEQLRHDKGLLEKELEEARALLSIAPAFIGFLDLKGRVTLVNDLAVAVIEARADQIIGQKFWECPWWKSLPDSAARVETAFDEARSGLDRNFDLPFISLVQGREELRWVNLGMKPFRDQNGHVTHVAASGVDISERVALQAATLTQEKALNDMLESMSEAYFAVDKDWRVTRMNGKHEKVVQKTRAEQLGRSLIDLFFSYPGAEETSYLSNYRKAMRERKPVYFEEYYPPLNIWTAVNVYPQDDGGLAIFFKEISPQKQQEAELRRAIEARDTFLGVASHELKTPLTSLKLQSQVNVRLLATKGPSVFTGERLRKALEGPLYQVDRLTRLVDDMLDVSRIAAGRLSISLEDTDLSSLVRGTVERFRAQLEAVGCAITEQIETGVTCQLDSFRFEQVIINLITNAIKYAPGKLVAFCVSQKGGIAQLTVRDHGPGIPTDKQGTIFERFERLGPTDFVNGLGLGLFISREIVRAHRGTIVARNAEGGGAEFQVRFPCK